jgi:hypothetical protein
VSVRSRVVIAYLSQWRPGADAEGRARPTCTGTQGAGARGSRDARHADRGARSTRTARSYPCHHVTPCRRSPRLSLAPSWRGLVVRRLRSVSARCCAARRTTCYPEVWTSSPEASELPPQSACCPASLSADIWQANG